MTCPTQKIIIKSLTAMFMASLVVFAFLAYSGKVTESLVALAGTAVGAVATAFQTRKSDAVPETGAETARTAGLEGEE